MKVLLTVILDRSGSMAGRETDVVGGVNKFIEEQKAVPGEALLSLVRFDTEYEQFRPMTALNEVEPLKASEFIPRGGTALLDAVGRTLGQLDDAWKTHQPDKAIVVIVTDGAENSSREFKQAQIKDMIEAREKSGQWTFIYLGAALSTFSDAHALGINIANTASYTNDAIGTQQLYAATSNGIRGLRTGSANAGLGGAIGGAPIAPIQPAQPIAAVNAQKPVTAWQPPQAAVWTPPAA